MANSYIITACVDFDGTIVDHEFPFIGQPVPGAIETLQWLQSLGYVELILHTMRSYKMASGDCLTPALQFLERSGVAFDQINTNINQVRWTDSPKVYGTFYIDDSAIGCPLITIPSFKAPCVDWVRVKKLLIKRIDSLGI